MSEFWRKQQVPTLTTNGTGGGWLDTFACNCVGPRNGQPRCPCQMRNVIEREGRWIVPEQDLGPVRSPTPSNPNRSEG